MLLNDLSFYRTLLRGLPLPDLLHLYERTLPDYAALAQAIADELDARLAAPSAA